MEREKAEFDILKKILEERTKRNWSEYMLAKNSDLTQSTISSWYRRDIQPSVASIEKICRGFGITLPQFFTDYLADDDIVLTGEQRKLLVLWDSLTAEQREAVLRMLEAFTE